jgi:hypothetical protein
VLGFAQSISLEAAVGSHDCWLEEASMRVVHSMPLGLPNHFLGTSTVLEHAFGFGILPLITMDYATTLKACMHWCTKEFGPETTATITKRSVSVEVHCFEHYQSFLLNRAGIFLHELSHIYNSTLGINHQPIVDMWEKAKAGGKYSMVDKLDGTRAIAYGIQSHVGAVRLAL